MSRISTLSYSIISLLGLALLLVGISTFAQPATTSAPLNTGTSAQNTSNLGVKLEATGLFDFAVQGSSMVGKAPIFSAGNMVFDGNVEQGGSLDTTLTIRGDLFAGASVQNQDGFIRNHFLIGDPNLGHTNSEPVCANQEGELVRCIEGCTHPLASNFNPQANEDDGTCDIAYGCTNPVAANYDSDAVMDDGSCEAVTESRAVCYFYDESNNAGILAGNQNFSIIPGTDCENCTPAEFVVPDNVKEGSFNMYLMGAGGAGTPYLQTVQRTMFIDSEVLAIYNGGSFTGNDPDAERDIFYSLVADFSQFTGQDTPHPLIARYRLIATAGSAGGTGMLKTVTGLEVEPGEIFNVFVAPNDMTNSESERVATIGPFLQYANNYSGFYPPVPGLITEPMFSNLTIQGPGGDPLDLLFYDITANQPIPHPETTVVRSTLGGTVRSASGVSARVPDSSLIESCIDGEILTGYTGQTSANDDVSGWDYESRIASELNQFYLSFYPETHPPSCSYKDVDFIGVPIAGQGFNHNTTWIQAPWKSIEGSFLSTTPDPMGVVHISYPLNVYSFHPYLQAIIPYSPGLGGRGGSLTSAGATTGETGNPGAVCFEWQEELDL